MSRNYKTPSPPDIKMCSEFQFYQLKCFYLGSIRKRRHVAISYKKIKLNKTTLSFLQFNKLNDIENLNLKNHYALQ